jgi:hypothetical protein
LALDAGNNKSHSGNRFISYGTGLTTEGVGFAVNGDGTFQRIAAGTVIGGYTVKSTDVVYSYALGANGCHYHGNDVAMPAGVYATFSFDYLVTGATNYPSTDFLANFEGAFSNSIGTANNTQNVWQRRTFTSGPSGSAASLRMLLYPGACGGRLADSGTLYFKNPKVEFTSYDTGDGNFSSMPNMITWYDLNNRTNNGTLTNTPYHFVGSNASGGYLSFDGTDDYIEGTIPSSTFTGPHSICCWFYRKTVKQWSGLFSNNVNTTSCSILTFIDSTNSLGTNQAGVNGTAIAVDLGADHLNKWIYAVITYAGVSSGSAVNVYAYKDGSLLTASGSLYWNMSSSSSYYVGRHWTSGVQVHDGFISQVQVYNKALSATEIAQNFNALRSRFGI